MSSYAIKDNNNEDIIVIFKNNSIIHNDSDNKNKKSMNCEYSMSEFITKINSIASSKNVVDIREFDPFTWM